MEAIEIEVTAREAKGTRAARRYRTQGLLPANLYSGAVQTDVLLNYKDFVRSAERAFTSQIFILKSEKPELNGARVVVREVQKEYLKNKVLHVDLYKLTDDSPVKVAVPLKINGEAPGVKVDGGVLVQSARNILVRCLPKNIPDILDVDISTLKVGQRIKTSDLVLPAGVQLRSDPMVTVVGVISGRAAVSEATTSAATPADSETVAGAAAKDGAKDGSKDGGKGAAAKSETPAKK